MLYCCLYFNNQI